MTSTPLLTVEGLVFGYPGLPLFDGWSHAFRPGLNWIRGENGCGKSTLLKLLGGAVDAQAGTVRHGSLEAQASRLDYRREVFWCGPDTIAFDHLKPNEYFGFIAGLYPSFDRAVAEDWVASLALEPFLDRPIRALSTGTRRKVAVLAAIAAGTSVIILDEPLAGLDQASLQVMRGALAAAADQRTRTWIIASHESLGRAAANALTIDLPTRD